MLNLASVGELAALYSLPVHRIRYAIESRDLPADAVVGGKRAFLADRKDIAQALQEVAAYRATRRPTVLAPR